MLTVEQLLKGKPTNLIHAVRPEQAVIEALELMAAKNIGAVLVMHGPDLIGIFSERDYARKGIIAGRKAKSTPVSEVMTPNVITIGPDQTIEACMELMSTKRIRHLPVSQNGEVLGILSISDIVTAIIREQAGHIESLQQYISGY